MPDRDEKPVMRHTVSTGAKKAGFLRLCD
ncbi:hypothetical protein FORC28_3583 [Escherichia coli]|nr:hypothetical protein FORC28_3583 [Escherichia coli]